MFIQSPLQTPLFHTHAVQCSHQTPETADSLSGPTMMGNVLLHQQQGECVKNSFCQFGLRCAPMFPQCMSLCTNCFLLVGCSHTTAPFSLKKKPHFSPHPHHNQHCIMGVHTALWGSQSPLLWLQVKPQAQLYDPTCGRPDGLKTSGKMGDGSNALVGSVNRRLGRQQLIMGSS